jgi:hypothetical protein
MSDEKTKQGEARTSKTDLIQYLRVCADLAGHKGGDGLAYVSPVMLRQAIELLGADETFARQPGDCEHERASVKCPDCGIDFIGTLMVPARHTLDCDMVKHSNCTQCNCGSSVDPNSSWHARQSPQGSVPAIGAPTAPAAPGSPEEPFDRKRFEQAPCYLCGYNGAGYYNTQMHRCAEQYHASSAAEFLRPIEKTAAPHTTEQDFQHWLSYSGIASASEADLRAAFYAGANAMPPEKTPCCGGSGKIPYTDEQGRERVKRCNKGHKP